MIFTSLKSRGRELLQQTPKRLAVHTHSPFLDDYVALLVKFAHDRVQESLRLQIGPQFQAVLGKRIMIGSLVVRRESIHSLAAIALDDLSELVGNDVLIRFLNGVLPC